MHINNRGPVKPGAGKSSVTVNVECYAGYRADETPRRFSGGERRVEIIEIIRQWQTPEARFFKVRGNDGNVHMLKHDGEHWSLE